MLKCGPLAVMICLSLCIALGCGGGDSSVPSGGNGGSGNGGGNGGSGNGPDAPTIAKISTYLTQNLKGSIPSFSNSLETYLKTLPGVQSVENDSGVVTAKLASGRQWGFIGNRDAVPASTAAAKPQQNLPSGKDCIVLNGFGAVNDGGSSAAIAGMLGRAGYSVSTGTPSIAALEGLGSQSIIFISTHGFYRAATGRFWFWTSDKVPDGATDDTDTVVAKYGREFVTTEYSAPTDRGPGGGYFTASHYCVSDKFLALHMKVKANGLIFLDACEAGKPGSPLPAALAGAGGAVALYNEDVDSTLGPKADKFIFDRLLGDNVKSGADIPKESPPQRPFDLKAIGTDAHDQKILPFKTLNHLGFNVDTDLMIKGGAQLSPSIEFVTFNGYKKEGSLTGTFGSKQGKVTINGTAATIKKWTSTQIDLESVPDTAHGDVQVSVDGRLSNKVKLTYWQLVLNYKAAGPGSFEVSNKLVLNIRADVHDFREKPHASTNKTLVTFSCDSDSKATWTASGSYQGVIMSGAGSASIISPSEYAGGPLLFGFGDLNTQTGNFDLNLVENVPSAYQLQAPGAPPQSIPLVLNPNLLIPPVDSQHFPSLRIPLNRQFEILAGSRTTSEGGTTFTLDWQTAYPVSPPTTEDAR